MRAALLVLLLSGCAIAHVTPDRLDALVLGRASVTRCGTGGWMRDAGRDDGLLDVAGPCVTVAGGAFSASWPEVLTALGTIAATLATSGVIP